MNVSKSDFYENVYANLIEGDAKALELLYIKYGPLLLKKLMGLVHDMAVSEELVHDVFLQVWNERSQLDFKIPIEQILLRKAKSKAIDYYRSTLRTAKGKELLMHYASQYHDSVIEMVYYKETQELLEKAIAQLPPQRQKIFRLCKLEGKSYEYAAQKFNVSVGTIKDHMAKSMRFLKAELKGQILELALFILIATEVFSKF